MRKVSKHRTRGRRDAGTEPSLGITAAAGAIAGILILGGMAAYLLIQAQRGERAGVPIAFIVSGIFLLVLAAIFAAIWVRSQKVLPLPARTKHPIAIVIAFSGLALTTGAMLTFALFYVEIAKSPAEHTRAVDGAIRLAVSEIPQGHARFFVCDGPVAEGVRLLVVKRNDQTVAVALDASEKSAVGFREKNGRLKCNGCDLQLSPDEVCVRTGGCYPVPVHHTIRNGMVIIQQAEIETASAQVHKR